MDESHKSFISDNDSRETYESWEACLAEGVRTRKVDKEVPDVTQQLHEKSLTEGRDILKASDEKERQKWLAKDGADWSGAFGHDPKAYLDSNGKKRREPGVDPPLHDPHHPSSDEYSTDDEYDISDDDSDNIDLGIQDADNTTSAGDMQGNVARHQKGRNSKETNGDTDTLATTDSSAMDGGESLTSKDSNKQNKRTEERRHRGMMQWKPARNAKFAMDEGKLGLSKLKKKVTGGLDGRQPGVETETA